MVQEKRTCYYCRVKKQRRKVLVSVAGRITAFLFLFSLFIALLYLQGNFQDFQESSLLLLLEAYRIVSLLYLAAAVSYIFIMAAAGRGSGRSTGARILITATGIAVVITGYMAASIVAAALGPVN